MARQLELCSQFRNNVQGAGRRLFGQRIVVVSHISVEKQRKKTNRRNIIDMVHLGVRALDKISG